MRDISPVRASRASPSKTPTPDPHLISLSALRLTAPLPQHTHPPPLPTVPTSATDILSNAPPWEAEGAPCGVGRLTVIPSSVGNVFASETFRCFVSVYNHSAHAVHNVSLSVQLETSSLSTVILLNTVHSPRDVLLPKANVQRIVKVAVPELGVHRLVCTARYAAAATSPVRKLQQAFPFYVLPPLEPTLNVRELYRPLSSLSVVSPAPHVTASSVHYLVDLRVVNTIPVPIYCTEATFLPKAPFRVRPLLRDPILPTTVSDEFFDADEIQGRSASMGTGDARNFLFHVYRPRAQSDIESLTAALQETRLASSASEQLSAGALLRTDRLSSRSMKPIASSRSTASGGAAEHAPRRRYSNDAHPSRIKPRLLGNMTVSWRSALGEVGHLENVVTVEEPPVLHSDVEVAVYAVPEQICAQRPFVARCAAKNNMKRAVRLYLQVRRDLVKEIVPVGVSGVSLGEVQPGCTVRCSLTMIPLVRGQHSLSGVRVVDIDSEMGYYAEPPVLSVT
eukprot:GFKZ01006357.1.p1 GENE.GFKZ01006357.1~~GFKZ01006357.1.p1  ORF type:complete len:518 (+),score=29.40 GFKZ01006357.1:31-1554(+)